MRRISHSEASTWLNCKRQYLYAFDYALEPKPASGTSTYSKALKNIGVNKGTLGHDILNLYYEALRINESNTTALKIARDYLNQLLLHPELYELELVTETMTRLNRYWEYYERDFSELRVLEVEKTYDLSLGAFNYVFKIDALMQNIKTNKLILMDHKFVYDFYTETELSLNSQMVKYLAALQHNGIFPDVVYLNQVRTRVLKNPTNTDLFNRAPLNPSRAKLTRSLQEQLLVSQEIMEWKELDLATRSSLAVRSSGTFPNPCKFCKFAGNLCIPEYDGGDVTHSIETNYQPNSYNYNIHLGVEND